MLFWTHPTGVTQGQAQSASFMLMLTKALYFPFISPFCSLFLSTLLLPAGFQITFIPTIASCKLKIYAYWCYRKNQTIAKQIKGYIFIFSTSIFEGNINTCAVELNCGLLVINQLEWVGPVLIKLTACFQWHTQGLWHPGQKRCDIMQHHEVTWCQFWILINTVLRNKVVGAHSHSWRKLGRNCPSCHCLQEGVPKSLPSLGSEWSVGTLIKTTGVKIVPVAPVSTNTVIFDSENY